MGILFSAVHSAFAFRAASERLRLFENQNLMFRIAKVVDHVGRRDYSMIKLSVIIICVRLNYELVYTLFNGLWSEEIAIMG